MNQYQKIKLLGSGTYGKCYLVTKVSSQQLFVMKQIDISDMNEQEKELVIRQAKILEILDHPHIIKIQQCFISDSGENFNIVMEYADGGDLASKIQEMKRSVHSQQQIINWFSQICIALKRVHEKKIIHRDLKCHNVFLMKDGTVKLGDFGIARKLNQTLQKIKTVVGTPYYMPPEIFDNKQYSFKADIWSLGVILYQLYCHKPPFDANSLGAIAIKVMNGAYAPINNPINKQMKKLITDMLQVNPNRRPSLSKILKTSILDQKVKFYTQKILKAQNPLEQINTKQNITQMQSGTNIQNIRKDQEHQNHNKKLILISENSEIDETQLFNQIKTPHYKNSHQSIHFKENGSSIKQPKTNIAQNKKPQLLRRRQISQPNLTPKGGQKWQLSKKMKSNNSLAQLQKKKSEKIQCMKKKSNKNKLILDEIKQIHQDVVEMKNRIYFNQGLSSESGEVSSNESKITNQTVAETLTYLLIQQIGEEKFNDQYKIFRENAGFSEKVNGNYRGLLSLLCSFQN